MLLKDNKVVGHNKIPAFVLKVRRYVITPYFKLFLQFSFDWTRNVSKQLQNCKNKPDLQQR